MKKILLELSFFVFAISFFACCAPSKEPNIKADKGVFIVQGIDAVENDSSRVLCKYKLSSDTLNANQKCDKSEHNDNLIVFFLTDTSGKYKIGDTLFLGLKPITIE